MAAKRGRYRKYLHDPKAKVPRTTLWLQRKSLYGESLRRPSRVNVEEARNNNVESDFNDVNNDLESVRESNNETGRKNVSIGDSGELICGDVTASIEINEQDDNVSESDGSINESRIYFENEDDNSESNDEEFVECDSSFSGGDDDTMNGVHNLLMDDEFASIPKSMFDPLYSGADISICASNCAIMSYAIKNKLSYSAIDNLLELLKLICPASSKLPSSWYKLKKWFQSFNSNYGKEKLCAECDMQSNEAQSCHGKEGYLIQVPIEKALKTVVLNHWNAFCYPMSPFLFDGKIHDVWSGAAVRSLKSFFVCPEHLGLSLSTDGVPVFKSSPDSLWPVYLVINNLPPNIRFYKENIILCAIWFGPKPSMKSLLKPVVEMLQSLHTVGISMKIQGEMKNVRAVLLNGIFDLVAKAPVVNMVQFNGKYGCLACLHPGSFHSPGRRIYLPHFEEGIPALRTHAGIMRAATKADRSGKSVLGIKGVSVLAEAIDLVDGIPVDYMHAVLEGIARWLLHAWFKSENHGKPYYLGRNIDKIDDLLLKQTPPLEFSRRPRSIKKHLKYWKASELRAWLLFYSLPLLIHFLPSLYLHHYSLLVCAIHILLMESISNTQINAAEFMLQDFITLLPELYGEISCTMNAHLLCHISHYVRLWGPLWTHSAFGVENVNGHLKHLFHSNSSFIDQLVFNLDVQQTLQLLIPHLLKNESTDTLDFLNIMSGRVNDKNMVQIEEHCYVIGKELERKIGLEEREALGTATDTIQIFSRLYQHGTLYYSTSYNKGGSKRNNQICYFNKDGQKFGRIEYFMLKPHPMAMVTLFQPSGITLLERAGHPCRQLLEQHQEINLLSIFIHEVKPLEDSTSLIAIPVTNIIGKAVHLKLFNSEFDYILFLPNNYERH